MVERWIVRFINIRGSYYCNDLSMARDNMSARVLRFMERNNVGELVPISTNYTRGGLLEIKTIEGYSGELNKRCLMERA